MEWCNFGKKIGTVIAATTLLSVAIARDSSQSGASWSIAQKLRQLHRSYSKYDPLYFKGLGKDGIMSDNGEYSVIRANSASNDLILSNAAGSILLPNVLKSLPYNEAPTSFSTLVKVIAQDSTGTSRKIFLTIDTNRRTILSINSTLPKNGVVQKEISVSGIPLSEVTHRDVVTQIVEGEKKTDARMSEIIINQAQLKVYPKSRDELCELARDPSKFNERFLDRNSRIATWVGEGKETSMHLDGKLKTGLCWWASRFERAATYLTVLRPELDSGKKLPSSYVKSLFEKIFYMRGVVEIPANSVLDFALKYPDELESVLSNAQIAESLKGGWMRGVEGSSCPSEKNRRVEIKKIIDEVKRGRIAYVMLQMSGPKAHSALVLGAEELDDQHYRLVVKDPASLNVRVVTKSYSDQTFHSDFVVPAGMELVDFSDENLTGDRAIIAKRFNVPAFPFLQETKDWAEISAALTRDCGRKIDL